MISYEDMFNRLDEGLPEDVKSKNEYNMMQQEEYTPTYFDPLNPLGMQETFTGFKTNPVLYNIDGYISPYPANNWGWCGNSSILPYIDDPSRLPALENNKIDPNKIFSSEINALRALAADQQKITKMFEKRLMESLTEKGKIGLTEEDVEAMSALTAARSAITSINKEQVNIKKNIADIRVKQNQSQNGSTTQTNGNTQNVKPGSSIDMGKAVLDNIFNATNSITPITAVDYKQANNNVDPDKLIDELVPNTNPYVEHESTNTKVYVVLGDTDADAEFVAFDENDNIVSNYPTPGTRIVSIDTTSGEAVDDLNNIYKIHD